MNILITGIHGFVGSNIIAALKAQHTLFGLDIVSPEKEGVVKTYGWNEQEQLPPLDCIIHLAGKAHDTKNTMEEQSYFEINVGLTKTIFEHFLVSKASKFIFFSSVKAVADTVEGEQLTEEVAPAPRSPYGESKLAAEEYILRYQLQSQSPHSGLPTSVFRLRSSAFGQKSFHSPPLHDSWSGKQRQLKPALSSR